MKRCISHKHTLQYILCYIIAGRDWCASCTYGVPACDGGGAHVLEAVLADGQLRQAGVLLGVGRRVPRRHLKPTHLQLTDAVLRLVGDRVDARFILQAPCRPVTNAIQGALFGNVFVCTTAGVLRHHRTAGTMPPDH